ncbi:hypothetical protein [Cytobacillus firmus]|nr:hypothetical protein [Cytobacillus firmus]
MSRLLVCLTIEIGFATGLNARKPMLAYYRHRLIFYGILTGLAGEWGVL